MAQLNVEQKPKNRWWLWVLIAIIVMVLVVYLLRNPQDNSTNMNVDNTDQVKGNSEGTADDNWGGIDFDVSRQKYEEITDADVDVRGSGEYAIYSLNETVLFGKDKSSLKPGAEQKLKQVAGSVEKRFNGDEVRIYGFTDTTGSASHNKKLALERAEAVRTWLVKNGNVAADKISLQPVGESSAASANSGKNQEQNRRVLIIVRK